VLLEPYVIFHCATFCLHFTLESTLLVHLLLITCVRASG